MIDIANEHLISVREVPRLLPPRPNGKRIHFSAVYRWTLRGVRGVRLESIRIGGTTYTSAEALQRFGERQAASRPGPAGCEPATPSVRKRQMERAAQEAEAILRGRPPR